MDEMTGVQTDSEEVEDGSVLAGIGRRARLVDAAIKSWKNQLVDLSARNNLLYYKTLKVRDARSHWPSRVRRSGARRPAGAPVLDLRCLGSASAV